LVYFDFLMKEISKTKSRAGRPVNANPEYQRENILRAALAEFSAKGFTGASVRTIAQEAGVAHGLIRHYFQGKEELFRSAADYLFGQVQQSLIASANHGSAADPVQQLQQQIRAFVHLSAKLPYMAAFLMQAGLDGGEHFLYVVNKYVKPLHELSLAPYREAVAQGLMRDFEPDFVFLIATHAATAPFANSAVRNAVVGDYAANSAKIDHYADTLIKVLMSGCLKPVGQ
jgi:TetR/AcrR family transcriptional regulator